MDPKVQLVKAEQLQVQLGDKQDSAENDKTFNYKIKSSLVHRIPEVHSHTLHYWMILVFDVFGIKTMAHWFEFCKDTLIEFTL